MIRDVGGEEEYGLESVGLGITYAGEYAERLAPKLEKVEERMREGNKKETLQALKDAKLILSSMSYMLALCQRDVEEERRRPGQLTLL